MDDHSKELLRRAAKAAGIPAYWSADGTIQNRPILVVKAGGKMGTMPYEEEWNPLRDDATALRLAVKLGLAIRLLEKCVFVESDPDTLLAFSSVSELEMYKGDPYAATRRAIVRAAAALGGNDA